MQLKGATYTWPGYIPSPHLTSLLREEVGVNRIYISHFMIISIFVGWSTQHTRFSLYDYFYFLKAGLVAAEKNRAAVVLVSMIAGGPGLGFWELGKYILRSPLIHGLTLIDIHGIELNCLFTKN